jgi:4-diphosphocytidyl-2-C-methyl-D-erythritol kinase
MGLTAFAPAKINLFLHVGSVQPDGYHPVCSLMVFADIGDRLILQGAEQAGFSVTGPFAVDVSDGPDNLVVRAATDLLRRAGQPVSSFELILEKNLPVAAGLGGGTSDAAAAVDLLTHGLGLAVQDEVMAMVVKGLGADGLACLHGAPVIATGRGDDLGPAPTMPMIDAVLVNPGCTTPTTAVYGAFDELDSGTQANMPGLPETFESAADLAMILSFCRNDLEGPAIRLFPQIGAVLETLRGEPEVLLARMSGSGATCFALCAGDIEAEGLADRLSSMQPDWWVRRCRLGGPWPRT